MSILLIPAAGIACSEMWHCRCWPIFWRDYSPIKHHIPRIFASKVKTSIEARSIPHSRCDSPRRAITATRRKRMLLPREPKLLQLLGSKLPRLRPANREEGWGSAYQSRSQRCYHSRCSKQPSACHRDTMMCWPTLQSLSKTKPQLRKHRYNAQQAMHIPLDGGNTFRLPHGFPMRMVLNSATISDALDIQN